MLTIYGRANSSNVQIVTWAVNELKLPHERLDYGLGHTSTASEEFRAINPMGLVPVIKDDGVTIFESAAILRYLSARYGDQQFWPSDPLRRASLDQWAEWAKNSFAPGVIALFYNLVRRKPQDVDPSVLENAVAAMKKLAAHADTRLGDGPWLDGDSFTFADIMMGHQLYRYYTMDFDRALTPALDAYYARLQTRPAFREHAMVSYEALRAVN